MPPVPKDFRPHFDFPAHSLNSGPAEAPYPLVTKSDPRDTAEGLDRIHKLNAVMQWNFPLPTNRAAAKQRGSLKGQHFVANVEKGDRSW
jgi:hypothetical protein